MTVVLSANVNGEPATGEVKAASVATSRLYVTSVVPPAFDEVKLKSKLFGEVLTAVGEAGVDGQVVTLPVNGVVVL